MISLAETAGAQPVTDLPRMVGALFSPSGPFAHASNYEFRPEQQQMAVAVAEALGTTSVDPLTTLG